MFVNECFSLLKQSLPVSIHDVMRSRGEGVLPLKLVTRYYFSFPSYERWTCTFESHMQLILASSTPFVFTRSLRNLQFFSFTISFMKLKFFFLFFLRRLKFIHESNVQKKAWNSCVCIIWGDFSLCFFVCLHFMLSDTTSTLPSWEWIWMEI
jgi:hypothetical protein